jgi:threonine-phosphate decarboxylase
MPVAHLVEPTYGEYRRASVLNELRTEVWNQHILGWSQDFLPRDGVGVFWTGHPNNPTGRAWDRENLLGLVDATLGLLTVVDESFLPFLPDEAALSLISAVPSRDNLLVLRSLSKVYALPGLRIGYAIASPDMVTRLRDYQQPWSVTLPAESAALAALDDADYLDRSVRVVASESARLIDRLWDLPGLRPAWPDRAAPGGGPPRTPNFLLASLTAETALTSTQAHEALARRGILVRECSDFRGLEVGALLTGTDQLVATQGHLRLAVRTPAENESLLAALTDVFRENASA